VPTYGATSISTGTVQVGDGTTTGSLGTGNVSNAGTLAFNRTDAITVGGTITGAGTINHLAGGTTTLSHYAGTGPVNVNTGTLAFATTNAPRQDTGVMVAMHSNTIGTNGVVDINNHDVMIGNSNLTTVETQILAGLYQIKPNGDSSDPGAPAITSSTWVTDGDKMLVPIEADTILGGGDPGSGAGIGQFWDNVEITQAGTIVIKYTYGGDGDLNGQVDFGDYGPIQDNFNKDTPGVADIMTAWLMGDYDLSGHVDFGDYGPVQDNFNKGVASPLGGLELPSFTSGPTGGSQNVPEPASLLLLGLGSAGMLIRRKRCKK